MTHLDPEQRVHILMRAAQIRRLADPTAPYENGSVDDDRVEQASDICEELTDQLLDLSEETFSRSKELRTTEAQIAGMVAQKLTGDDDIDAMICGFVLDTLVTMQ